MCEKCGNKTHRDDAMNRRCNGCEHLVRLCDCKECVTCDASCGGLR